MHYLRAQTTESKHFIDTLVSKTAYYLHLKREKRYFRGVGHERQ
jgi:hypothetical protein